MIQPGSEADLAEEALGTQGRGELRVEQLQGDPPVVLEVLGEIDRGHSAAAELALETVAVAESVPELDDDIGHSGGLRWRRLESVPSWPDFPG
jgi:hypothetical protein